MNEIETFLCRSIDLFSFGRLQKVDCLFQPELLRPGFERSVARDLVVLDRLCRSRKARVACLCLAKLRGYFVALADNAFDRFAGRALGLRPMSLNTLSSRATRPSV